MVFIVVVGFQINGAFIWWGGFIPSITCDRQFIRNRPTAVILDNVHNFHGVPEVFAAAFVLEQFEGHMKNGKMKGLWTEWVEDGKKIAEIQYKAGEVVSRKEF